MYSFAAPIELAGPVIFQIRQKPTLRASLIKYLNPNIKQQQKTQIHQNTHQQKQNIKPNQNALKNNKNI